MATFTFVGGYLQVAGLAGGPAFHMFASDALITNTSAAGDTGNCAPQNSPYGVGAHLLDATFAGSLGLGNGYAELGTTVHQRVWYEGTLNFKGKFTLTNAMPTPLVIVRAFTLTGNLIGYLTDPFIGPATPIFSRKVSGKGRAILELSWTLVGGAKAFDFERITYHFQP